jgi:hypothetical protein
LPGGLGIGDRGYWDPALRRLAEGGVVLLAPYQHKSKDPDRARSARLSAVRYRLETVNGQLAERYHIKRTWAKDRWHLCHRLIRKILSHTVMIWVAVHAGIAPLSLDRLWAAENLHTALAIDGRPSGAPMAITDCAGNSTGPSIPPSSAPA